MLQKPARVVIREAPPPSEVSRRIATVSRDWYADSEVRGNLYRRQAIRYNERGAGQLFAPLLAPDAAHVDALFMSMPSPLHALVPVAIHRRSEASLDHV